MIKFTFQPHVLAAYQIVAKRAVAQSLGDERRLGDSCFKCEKKKEEHTIAPIVCAKLHLRSCCKAKSLVDKRNNNFVQSGSAVLH